MFAHCASPELLTWDCSVQVSGLEAAGSLPSFLKLLGGKSIASHQNVDKGLRHLGYKPAACPELLRKVEAGGRLVPE